MAAESDLIIGQSTLRVHVAVCADAVDDEAVVDDGGLEPLQSVPWKRNGNASVLKNPRTQRRIDKTYMSYCRGRTSVREPFFHGPSHGRPDLLLYHDARSENKSFEHINTHAALQRRR